MLICAVLVSVLICSVWVLYYQLCTMCSHVFCCVVLDVVCSAVIFGISCVQLCFVGCHVLSCVVWTWLDTGVWPGAHGWEGRGNSLYILPNQGLRRINIMLTQVYPIIRKLNQKQWICQIRLAW